MYAHPSHEMSEETAKAIQEIQKRLAEIERKLEAIVKE